MGNRVGRDGTCVASASHSCLLAFAEERWQISASVLYTAPRVDASSVYLTGRPELWCEFDLENGKPVDTGDGYRIRAFLKNAPEETLSVVYHFNDESYRDEGEEFIEIPNDGRPGFEAYFESYGDFEIRGTIWYPKTGQGVKTRLSPALERSHGNAPKGPIRTALKHIRDN